MALAWGSCWSKCMPDLNALCAVTCDGWPINGQRSINLAMPMQHSSAKVSVSDGNGGTGRWRCSFPGRRPAWIKRDVTDRRKSNMKRYWIALAGALVVSGLTMSVGDRSEAAPFTKLEALQLNQQAAVQDVHFRRYYHCHRRCWWHRGHRHCRRVCHRR